LFLTTGSFCFRVASTKGTKGTKEEEMVFLTADTHFGHGNIILHCDRRPWIIRNPNYNHNIPYDFVRNNNYSVNLQKHDEDLKINWNNIVGKNDQVIIAGDFAYKNHKYHINSLNGKKTLVKGNHDKSNGDFYNTFTNDNLTPDLSDIRKECSSALKRFKNDYSGNTSEMEYYLTKSKWGEVFEADIYYQSLEDQIAYAKTLLNKPVRFDNCLILGSSIFTK
jgi:hypothetical protein